VTRHAAITDILRDPALFSSRNQEIPRTERNMQLLPLTLDPPEHTPYRQILMQIFAPSAMVELEGHVRDWTNRLIDEVIAGGECDFVRSISSALPVSVFMQMMGLPLGRLEEFRGWVDEAFRTTDTERRMKLYAEIVTFMTTLIDARMEKRQNDIISRLLDSEVDGRRLSFEEVQGVCLLLFIAGLDTVVNAMSFAVRHLAGDPALLARFTSEPNVILTAVEEFLRRYAFTNTCRIVTRDAGHGGVRFREGDMVFLALALAGLDDREIADPLAFDPDRKGLAHKAFGGGPHQCAGRHLARIELRILFEELAKRITNLRLKPGTEPTYRAGFVMAIESLWVEFDAV
jgi:cytochrome P450